MAFRVIPIPTSVAVEARSTLVSPGVGLPITASVATAHGYGPCRHCLCRTREGERRLLLIYNPYQDPGETPVVGPIFIHDASCEAFSIAGFPEELRGIPMVLRGHLQNGEGVVVRHLHGQEPESAIEAVFTDPRIAFIAIQNLEAGCFIARVERLPKAV